MKPFEWFIIVNPKAGNGAAIKQWPKIKQLLIVNGFDFEYKFTNSHEQATNITVNTIKKGCKNIVCVGGDGTLHAIVNGLMLQNTEKSSAITIGLIPIGTGNDWAKNYNIPKTINGAFNVILNNKTKNQDIGKIDFLETKLPSIYFNNLAGVGFDGLVAKKTEKLKFLGSLSYLIAACQSLITFKNFKLELVTNNKHIQTKSLMVLVGLCNYSGGGMRLTNNPDPEDGLFDISNVTNFNTWDFLKNLSNLYNGNVYKANKVETFKTDSIKIIINKKDGIFFMQADGEVFNAENVKISIIKKAFSFYS